MGERGRSVFGNYNPSLHRVLQQNLHVRVATHILIGILTTSASSEIRAVPAYKHLMGGIMHQASKTLTIS
jgi:hypothetical protein